MKPAFTHYKDRSISYIDTLLIKDCSIKIYTISFRTEFKAISTLNEVLKEVEQWVDLLADSHLPTHKNAFLIVHEAREGTIILFNWWTGENMIETKLFYASFETPNRIEPSLFNSKQLVCIWELEVFFHERNAWIKHVLSNRVKADFEAYQKDYYQQEYERI